MGTQQANFRLSKAAADLLEGTAKKYKIKKTDVVEYCVARYAADLDVDVAGATKVLLKQIATTVALNSSEKSALFAGVDLNIRHTHEADRSTAPEVPRVLKSRQGKAQ